LSKDRPLHTENDLLGERWPIFDRLVGSAALLIPAALLAIAGWWFGWSMTITVLAVLGMMIACAALVLDGKLDQPPSVKHNILRLLGLLLGLVLLGLSVWRFLNG
jgi:uncharacterized membrane protein